MEIQVRIAEHLKKASELSVRFGAHARKCGASDAEVAKLVRIGFGVWAMLLWQFGAGEYVPDVDSLLMTSVLSANGISTAALVRDDIPLAVRQPLLPILRPDAHAVSVLWWDEVAHPRWFEPFVRSLEESGEIASITVPSLSAASID